MSKSTIAVVGPGALGLSLAAQLHQGKTSVFLIDYKEERAASLTRSGFVFEHKGKTTRLYLPCFPDLETSTPSPDGVILCVKAHQTETAIKMLQRSGYQGSILSLQNGIGNVEAIKKYSPQATLFVGVTARGATLLAEDHVHLVSAGLTVVGSPTENESRREAWQPFLQTFRESGIAVEWREKISSFIWGKLLVNVGINPLTAILNVPNGKLLEMPSSRGLLTKLIEEAWQVVKMKNISLPYANPVAQAQEICRLTAENRSSMWQDLSRGKRTEINFINGAIVKEAKKLSIPCPLNQAVTELVQGLETLRMHPQFAPKFLSPSPSADRWGEEQLQEPKGAIL